MKWISVNESLPELDTRVIAIDSSGWAEVVNYGIRDKDTIGFDLGSGCCCRYLQEPTHWMPIPKGPE